MSFSEAIFSFFLRIIDMVFPIFWFFLIIFLIFSCKKEIFTKIRNSAVLRMIILYFVMILIFRFVLLKSGYPYQGRYLHQLTILSVFPAAFGFCKSLDLIKKYIKRELTICFLLIVVIICAVKILIPPDNKEWLKLIPETIIAHSPSNEGKIFLISSIRDSRLSYYSNAEYHPFIKHNDSVGKITERAIYTKKIIDGKEKLVRENFGKGYNALCNAVKNWGGDNVFILLDSDKETIENQLKELGIKINFIHISDFKTHKGQKISLYQGEKDK